MHLAAQRLLDGVGHPRRPPQLVLILRKGAADENVVERQPVRGGENLRVDNVGVRRRACPGDNRQQAGMVAGENGDFGHAAERIGGDLRRQHFILRRRLAQELRMTDLARQIDLHQ